MTHKSNGCPARYVVEGVKLCFHDGEYCTFNDGNNCENGRMYMIREAMQQLS